MKVTYYEVSWDRYQDLDKFAAITGSYITPRVVLGTRHFASEEKANELKSKLEAAAEVLGIMITVWVKKHEVED